MKNVLVVVALVLMIASALPFSADASAVRKGDKAPAVDASTLDGKTVSSKELKDGESLLLFFWATWCPYCIDEIPKISDAYKTLGPKGMKFLAVNPGINDSRKKIEKYVEKYQIPYPVVFDSGAKITKSFGIRGAPTYVILDKDGIVRYRGNKMPKDLAAHVKQPTSTPNSPGK